jgi:hypothetical protein
MLYWFSEVTICPINVHRVSVSVFLIPFQDDIFPFKASRFNHAKRNVVVAIVLEEAAPITNQRMVSNFEIYKEQATWLEQAVETHVYSLGSVFWHVYHHSACKN